MTIIVSYSTANTSLSSVGSYVICTKSDDNLNESGKNFNALSTAVRICTAYSI